MPERRSSTFPLSPIGSASPCRGFVQRLRARAGQGLHVSEVEAESGLQIHEVLRNDEVVAVGVGLAEVEGDRVVVDDFDVGRVDSNLGEGAEENLVLHALEAHDRTLDAHLGVEEEAVIPLLLALEPEEFHRYYKSPLSLLIARQDHARETASLRRAT